MMRTLFLLGAALVVSGCEQAGPPDCEQVMAEIYACMDRTTSGRQEDLVNCIPMQDAEEIEGTWARDFEFNQFYEDQRISFEQGMGYLEPSTALWPVEGVEEIGTPGMTGVYWVRFVGRRPRCELGDEYDEIWLDRILEYEVIEERPSEWQ